jgi:hypothetical protein
MPKMMPPNVKIVWVPVAGLTTPAAPKATELVAGTDLSLAIETGYKLGPMDSDVDNSKTIADEGNSDTPTMGKYEGMLTLFRDDVGSGTNVVPTPSTVFTTAFNLFKSAKVEGWLVKRLGKKQAVAFAAGDVVSAFRFISDYPREVEGTKMAPNRVEVEFFQQGSQFLNVTCVA